MINLCFSIQTEDRIFLVLEYCDGGDLAAYLNRRGKVSEAVARHFMWQLGMLGIRSCLLVFLSTINTLVLLQNNNNKKKRKQFYLYLRWIIYIVQLQGSKFLMRTVSFIEIWNHRYGGSFHLLLFWVSLPHSSLVYSQQSTCLWVPVLSPLCCKRCESHVLLLCLKKFESHVLTAHTDMNMTHVVMFFVLWY